MSNLELLDRAASSTTCQVLGIAGGTLVGSGVATFAAGGLGLVPFTAGAAALLAANYLCPEMPLGDAPGGGGINGCGQMEEGGYGQIQYTYGGDWQNWSDFPYATGKAKSITEPEVYQSGRGDWGTAMDIVYTTGEGGFSHIHPSKSAAEKVQYRILPIVGTCEKEEEPELGPIPPETFDPISYADPVTNCNYTVQLQGFAEEQPGGVVQPVFLIEGATEEVARAGGVMGGCNFPPVIYAPGFGGGGRAIPVPPGGSPPDGPGGVPWWAGPMIGGAVGAALGLIGDEIARMSEPDVNEGSFLFIAPCDVGPDGNPLTHQYNFGKSSFNQRLLAHQVALMDMLQQHLNWKTPTCGGNDYEESEGDWRTVSFRSDQTSPYGTARIRKRFRYRSVSGWSYDAIINHWKDFVWESGPIVVKHLGSSWGTPQVWAATADEGKRVIRHAAGEAGIDPDQVGRWSISGSRSPRLGVSDTMRVDTTGGYYWITSRDGSDGRPIVAALPDPGSEVDITEIG
jgi:hypothetical protein